MPSKHGTDEQKGVKMDKMDLKQMADALVLFGRTLLGFAEELKNLSPEQPESKWIPVEELKNLSPAQPEREKGKWEVCNILDYAQRPTGRRVGRCPYCGHLTDEFRKIVESSKKLTNFCPNCGADMREENDNGRFN